MQNLVGQTFNRLTVVAYSHVNAKRKHYWDCRCACGAIRKVQTANLQCGLVKSCGCYRTEVLRELRTTHGGAGTRAYECWQGMRRRCNDPGRREYPSYGGRGIRVCERWDSFENFLADMGEPEPGMSIDRIDNDGNYEPGNCRWATMKEQARNQRHVVWLEHNGQRKRLVEWAEETGIPFYQLYQRMRNGFTSDKILTSDDLRFKHT